METKSLLFGLIGFFLGGLLVSSVAAIEGSENNGHDSSMSQMTEELKGVTGEKYDKLFVESMIMHHQSAVDMAKLSAERTDNENILNLSDEIVTAQKREIEMMERWQQEWGTTMPHNATSH
jgi:uncharacterized protein (DUF305 family)